MGVKENGRVLPPPGEVFSYHEEFERKVNTALIHVGLAGSVVVREEHPEAVDFACIRRLSDRYMDGIEQSVIERLQAKLDKVVILDAEVGGPGFDGYPLVLVVTFNVSKKVLETLP